MNHMNSFQAIKSTLWIQSQVGNNILYTYWKGKINESVYKIKLKTFCFLRLITSGFSTADEQLYKFPFRKRGPTADASDYLDASHFIIFRGSALLLQRRELWNGQAQQAPGHYGGTRVPLHHWKMLWEHSSTRGESFLNVTKKILLPDPPIWSSQ